MDWAELVRAYMDLVINGFTIGVSLLAVFFWVRLFKRFYIKDHKDQGWLWVFAAVLMVLLLNVSTLLLMVSNGRIPLGVDSVFIVDTTALEFVSTFSRAVLAILLTVGAYLLYEPIKGHDNVKIVCTPVEPKAENPSAIEAKYDLRAGVSYLVKEGHAGNVSGIELFIDLVTHGKMGLCATRKYPPKIREKYNIQKTPLIWLTQEKGYPESIHPSDMTELSHMVKHFITKGEDTAILVDGLEYLILHNSFEDVLRMIQGLDDVVVQNKARLIVSVDPSAINEQQFHLLKRELTEFGPNIQ